MKELLPPVFNSWFKLYFEPHCSHDSRRSNLGYHKIPSCRTKIYGRYSIIVNAIYVSNYLQSCHQNLMSHQLRKNKLKDISLLFSLIVITNRIFIWPYKVFKSNMWKNKNNFGLIHLLELVKLGKLKIVIFPHTAHKLSIYTEQTCFEGYLGLFPWF